MNRKLLLLALAISILVSFLLYGTTIKGEFVGDDILYSSRVELREPKTLLTLWKEPLVPQNPWLSAYRPLNVFSFALNFILFGESPVSFHIVNILLNGLNTFLVFILLIKLFKNKYLAIFSTLFYAFLPIHTEAVANLRARDELLSTLLTLTAWFTFLWATEKEKIRGRGILLSSAILFLASLAKDWALVRGGLMLAVYWAQKRPKISYMVKMGLYFIPAAFTYLLVRYFVLGKYFLVSEGIHYTTNPLIYIDFSTKIWTVFKILYLYVSKIIFPLNLSATYYLEHLKLVSNPLDSWESLAGIVIAELLVFLIFHKKLRKLPLGIGALTFLIPYLVVSQLFSTVADVFAERWMYFPSIGISMMAGYVFLKIYEYRKWLAVAIMLPVLSGYAVRAINRNQVWLSPLALFQSMVADAPDSIHGHYSLATYYLSQNETDLAKKEAEEAYRINQTYPPLLGTLSIVAIREKRVLDAKRYLLDATQQDPTYARGYFLLGGLYYAEGDYTAALKLFSKNVDISKDRPTLDLIAAYAATLAKLGKYQESLAFLEKHAVKHKDNVRIKFLFALNLYKTGRIEEAKLLYGGKEDFVDNLDEF